MESGVEIVCTVGEDECSGVDKSKDKMKRWGCEGRRGKHKGRLFCRMIAVLVLIADFWLLCLPSDESVVKVVGTGDKDEAMGRKDSSQAFMMDRGAAFDADADIRIKTGSPHEDKIFAEFVDAILFCITFFAIVL